MNSVFISGKEYSTDPQGFLRDYEQWDEEFASALAPKVDIPGGLSEIHWNIIRFIRNRFKETGECPLVYEACRHVGATSRKMKELFPSGYLRGACRLAGITYASRRINYYGEEADLPRPKSGKEKEPQKYLEKTYLTDVFGFIVDHEQWDENFAAHRVADMKVPGGYSQDHWKIINSLRKAYEQTNSVPSVYECCDQNDITIEELEHLFPAGYHRGAVKAAGLRVKNAE